MTTLTHFISSQNCLKYVYDRRRLSMSLSKYRQTAYTNDAWSLTLILNALEHKFSKQCGIINAGGEGEHFSSSNESWIKLQCMQSSAAASSSSFSHFFFFLWMNGWMKKCHDYSPDTSECVCCLWVVVVTRTKMATSLANQRHSKENQIYFILHRMTSKWSQKSIDGAHRVNGVAETKFIHFKELKF